MYDNLSDDDQFTLIQLLHEIEHNWNPCPYEVMSSAQNCPVYQYAALNADRGYLVVIDGLITRKIEDAQGSENYW